MPKDYQGEFEKIATSQGLVKEMEDLANDTNISPTTGLIDIGIDAIADLMSARFPVAKTPIRALQYSTKGFLQYSNNNLETRRKNISGKFTQCVEKLINDNPAKNADDAERLLRFLYDKSSLTALLVKEDRVRYESIINSISLDHSLHNYANLDRKLRSLKNQSAEFLQALNNIDERSARRQDEFQRIMSQITANSQNSNDLAESSDPRMQRINSQLEALGFKTNNQFNKCLLHNKSKLDEIENGLIKLSSLHKQEEIGNDITKSFGIVRAIAKISNLTTLATLAEVGSEIGSIWRGIARLRALPIHNRISDYLQMGSSLQLIECLQSPIQAIAKVISLVSSLFSVGQPSEYQLIMRQLQKITEQIAELQKQTNRRFDGVHRHLRSVSQLMTNQFVFLNTYLTNSLDRKLDNIQDMLDYVTDIQTHHFVTTKLQPINDSIAMLKFIHQNSTNNLSSEIIMKLAMLQGWHLSDGYAHDKLLTGCILVDEKSDSLFKYNLANTYKQLLRMHDSGAILGLIQSVAEKRKWIEKSQASLKLPNLTVWQKAITTYLEMLAIFPERQLNSLPHLRDCLEVAKSYRNVLTEIATKVHTQRQILRGIRNSFKSILTTHQNAFDTNFDKYQKMFKKRLTSVNVSLDDLLLRKDFQLCVDSKNMLHYDNFVAHEMEKGETLDVQKLLKKRSISLDDLRGKLKGLFLPALLMAENLNLVEVSCTINPYAKRTASNADIDDVVFYTLTLDVRVKANKRTYDIAKPMNKYAMFRLEDEHRRIAREGKKAKSSIDHDACNKIYNDKDRKEHSSAGWSMASFSYGIHDVFGYEISLENHAELMSELTPLLRKKWDDSRDSYYAAIGNLISDDDSKVLTTLINCRLGQLINEFSTKHVHSKIYADTMKLLERFKKVWEDRIATNPSKTNDMNLIESNIEMILCEELPANLKKIREAIDAEPSEIFPERPLLADIVGTVQLLKMEIRRLEKTQANQPTNKSISLVQQGIFATSSGVNTNLATNASTAATNSGITLASVKRST